MRKEQKEIQNQLQTFITNSKKEAESAKTSSKADLEALKKCTKAELESVVKNQPKPQDLTQYTTNSQFKTRQVFRSI